MKLKKTKIITKKTAEKRGQSSAELEEEIKESDKRILELEKEYAKKEEESISIGRYMTSLRIEITKLSLYPFKDKEDALYNRPLKSNEEAGAKVKIEIDPYGSVKVIPYKKDGTLSSIRYKVTQSNEGKYRELFRKIDTNNDTGSDADVLPFS